MNQLRTPIELGELHEQLLTTYADLGYQRELVSHWALPGRDLRQLLTELEEAAPQRLLEVGTFVGLSTLAMAFKTGEGAVIHTVDPNFPLQVELEAMRTQSREADLTVRSQTLARQAAERLGLSHKIVFHAGGFSTPATFASTKTDPTHTTPVVGPDVCRSHGPFDLIFIDGLHYSHAVLEDLRLARPHLRPGGRIVLHDVIGCWGSNVRRAVFQFLAETPGMIFRHGRYADLYEAIGVIEQASDRSTRSAPTATVRQAGSDLLEQPGFTEQLAAVVHNLCRPSSVLCLGSDHGGLLAQFGRWGAGQLIGVGTEAQPVSPGTGPIRWEAFDYRSVYRPNLRMDLCLFITDEHDLTETSCRDLVASCVACSDTVLFCSTPPGEAGVARDGALPIENWVREFWKHGYRFHDLVRPSFEPLRFANSFAPIYDIRSTELASIYLVRRDASPPPWSSEAVEAVLVEKERRVEDLTLQGLFSDIALRHALKESHASQQWIAEKDRRLLEQEQTIGDCQELTRQSEASVRVLEGMLARSSALVQEQEQTIVQHRHETSEYQRRIAEQGRVITGIQQSLEYRVALRLGRYPRLLRLAVRCWRALFGRRRSA
ncbi:O-methyltransferase [Nitrospira japonica]|nr:class I SAM-dependent methyltransferase [Nitrospira japonica]